MLVFEMLVHELSVEQGPSLATSAESNNQAVECDCKSDGQHVWVLVGKCYLDMSGHFNSNNQTFNW